MERHFFAEADKLREFIQERVVPSTSRGAESYRKMLFPETPDLSTLLHELEGQTILDIGAGLTPKNPYSLTNLVHEYNQNISSDRRIAYIPIEPRAGLQGIPSWFTGRTSLIENWLITTLVKLCTGKQDEIRWLKNAPAEKAVVAAKVPDLPVKKEVVNRIVCSYLIPFWIKDPKKVLSIFKAFYDSMLPQGEVRLYPVSPKYLKQFSDTNSDLGEYISEHFFMRMPTVHPDENQIINKVREKMFGKTLILGKKPK